VNREIPAESARNGEIPKFQKPLFGTTPPSALSGLVVQTFPSSGLCEPERLRRQHRGIAEAVGWAAR
ncbi:hypothetical protein, partial [Xanthomonas phaseoli]|uniref:hypothetical protein n=1 Tax=Xanthomonas phaseoli TaxID=1985254 RepID=UPI001E645473